MMLLYTCWIIFMFNQRPDFGRESVGFLDATLNKQIGKGMHTYDDDCAFDISLIWSEMDHYYLVHWCDWILASIVIRDPYILHFWHLFNEVIELSFQHRLPHFRECWWDHIILDILLSNIPAVTLGLWIVDKVGMRRYDWLGRAGKESFWDWEIWQCHRRYGNVVLSLVLLTFHFVDGFFIMNAFLIPPVHPFPPSRMLLWFFYGAIAYRECFVDIETWNTPGR
jgi:phosphatidylserine synthase 2